MTQEKKYEMPNEKLLEDSFKAFSELSTKMVELNQLYWEQAKLFFKTGMAHSQSLYRVSTPEEFAKTLGEIMTENGALLSKAFLEKMDVVLKLCHDSCGSGCCNLDDMRSSMMQFYDFYSKLMPSPVALKLDDVIKNAASGNYDAMHSLHTLAEGFLTQFGGEVQKSVESVVDNLGQIAKKKPTK